MIDTGNSAAGNDQATRLIGGLGEIAHGYDVIFCDVWGVLHNGVSAHQGAGEALTRFREDGKAVILISNAPRPGAGVVAQLDKLGVPRSAFDDIVTSGDLTRTLVSERISQRVFHLGPPRDQPIFKGLDARLAPLEEADYVVCSGLFDDDSDTVADYAPMLAAMRSRDMLMICANPDMVVERGDRLLPCAGALAAAYEDLGGRAIYSGKPHGPVYEVALARAEAILGRKVTDRRRILAVGDAIRTDIAGAFGFGTDALFIARGIHTHELGLDDGPLDHLRAAAWFARQAHQPLAALERLVWG